MKYFRIPSRPQELWSKIKIVVKYFVLGGPAAPKIKMQLQVVKTLRPYSRKNLIAFRAYFTYLLPYISKELTLLQRHQILVGHYTALQRCFSPAQLDQLFKNGIECYREGAYSVNLQAVTSHLEFEGSMYLRFHINQLCLFALHFTFAAGQAVGQPERVIIFISAVQGTKNEFENIRRATKYFQDTAIPVILLKVLEAIAAQLSINRFIGIAGKNQLSFKQGGAVEHFNEIYDRFWIHAGGVLSNGHYLIHLPLLVKPIQLISQRHRNRALRKRKKLKEIYSAVSKTIRLLPGQQ